MSAEHIGKPLFRGILDQDSEPVHGILRAAEQCFNDSGYHGTSIREIAEVAGVSKSVLHYHFQSKEHIFLEVQIRVYNRLAARVMEAVGDEGSTAERGLFALDALFDALRAGNDLPVQAEIWARALTNDRILAPVNRLREYLREAIIETLDRLLGLAWEEIPIGKEAAADLLLGTMIGLGLQAGFEKSFDRVEAAFEAVRHLVEVALKTGESARGTTVAAEPAGKSEDE